MSFYNRKVSFDSVTCFMCLLLRFISISISSPYNNSTFHCAQTMWRETYPVWWNITVIPLSRLIWATATLQSCILLTPRARGCFREEDHLKLTVLKTMVLPTWYPFCSYQLQKETAYKSYETQRLFLVCVFNARQSGLILRWGERFITTNIYRSWLYVCVGIQVQPF